MASERASALRTLNPAYFALVMATGIVSLAGHALGAPGLPRALLYLNVAFYAALWLLTIARIARHGDAVRADFLDHRRAVGFFTTVAATGVLGNQLLLIAGWPRAALAAWGLTVVLWVVLTYGIFTSIVVQRVKPSLPEGIHGGWLVAVVATQSVALLSGQLAQGFGDDAGLVLFASLVWWLGGGMLYIWIIALIFYRYAFFALEPSDLAPPYWINMGAMAISTLAGTVLVDNAAGMPLLTSLAPFITGMTLLFWATATWWIPMLLVLGVWRHIYRRFPLRYDPLYWGAVFPLGMYTLCTHRLAAVLDLEFLQIVARVGLPIAMLAWGAAAVGLAARLLGMRPRPKRT